MKNFVTALKTGDIETMIATPKSDIHSHGGRGGNPNFIAEKTGKKIPTPPTTFESLSHMQEWFNENVKPICKGREGNILRWEACFAEAKRNHIVRLALSFGIGDIELAGGMESFINLMNGFKNSYCPELCFEPELAYSVNSNVNDELGRMSDFLDYHYFKSIDLNSGENVKPFRYFTPLYLKAEAYGLRKKAHVGEFGSAEDVVSAVEELGLDEVHHGIAAASSEGAMTFLRERNIQLNVCPTSNVMLKVAKSYAKHPIQTLVRNGVPVTINTDDLLIFNSTIDQEYLALYQSGTLTAEELDAIRKRGIE